MIRQGRDGVVHENPAVVSKVKFNAEIQRRQRSETGESVLIHSRDAVVGQITGMSRPTQPRVHERKIWGGADEVGLDGREKMVG